MRIEWNHKLIKRDLFVACKGFCHTVKQEAGSQNNKENVRLAHVLLLLCVCVGVCVCQCLCAAVCVLEN